MIKNMHKVFIPVTLILLVLAACKPETAKYTINADINGAAGRYIKVIDMTMPGLPLDSIELDMGGKFTFEKKTNQPGDYIFYFNNPNYIRLTPLPHEIITVTGNISNLVESTKIKGSAESEQVLEVIKHHYRSVLVIDTLNAFFMKNQLNPGIDTIVERLTRIGDSVINSEKQYFEDFIKKNPGTFASYIALSQKFMPNYNLFTLKNDLPYFEMVDTALLRRFDTIDIVKMMDAYIAHGKLSLKQRTSENSGSMINKQAPEISLPNVYGDTLSLSMLKGKYVLVDFWGSWCRPCRKQNENLRNAYRTYRYKGFEIFQVALERDKTDWKNTIREDKLYWKNQVSELKYMDSNTAREYNVKALPANFLINPEGKIIAINLFGDELLKKLDEIFNPKPSNGAANQP